MHDGFRATQIFNNYRYLQNGQKEACMMLDIAGLFLHEECTSCTLASSNSCLFSAYPLQASSNPYHLDMLTPCPLALRHLTYYSVIGHCVERWHVECISKVGAIARHARCYSKIDANSRARVKACQDTSPARAIYTGVGLHLFSLPILDFATPVDDRAVQGRGQALAPCVGIV